MSPKAVRNLYLFLIVFITLFFSAILYQFFIPAAFIAGIAGPIYLAFFFFKEWQYKKLEKELKKKGFVYQADFIGIAKSDLPDVNGIRPFIVHCQYGERIFKSPFLWSNPEKYLDFDMKIPVYIDPENPNKYHVDIFAVIPKIL